MTKQRVAILFGGRSAEHEVSIKSARNVYNSLNKNTYEILLIKISKNGQWYLSSYETLFGNIPEHEISQVSFIQENGACKLFEVESKNIISSIDVVFPVLHGPNGEDGSIQGFLRVLGAPFVGSDILGSAIGMDKDVSKRLLRDANLPILDSLTFFRDENISFESVHQKLGLPFFVKPANLGSSVGVSKVTNKEDFEKSIKNAFEFDSKILIEKYIPIREIECAVLGNEKPEASIAGEIIPTHEFYDYDAKYIDSNGAMLQIPANISEDMMQEVQNLACKTFSVLCLEGMARVDFFLSEDEKLYINEVNTIPGFTDISMYPKLWQGSGISYTELVDRLIQLAIKRYKKESTLKTSI